MAATNASSLPRNPAVYRYLREDGVVANILSRAERGSGYRQACSICQKKCKSNKQAYAHIKTHGDAVRVQRIGVEGIDKETTICSNGIIDPSNGRASGENGCVTRMCLPSYATARDVTEVNNNAGVVEGLEERTFDLDCIDADRPNEYDWNESDGVGEIGEQFRD